MSEPRLHPSLAKRFRSGRACLDFLHTSTSHDGLEPELLRDGATLERWLGHVLGLGGVQAGEGDLAAAYRLREALWQLAQARIAARTLPESPVRTANAFAAAPPPVPELSPAGTALPTVATATAALSSIARDAIDLLSGPLGDRIRVCAAEDCALMFVDASRPGTRRWCSMQHCGNLAKVCTHRATMSSPS